MFYIYILHSKKDSRMYTGYTSDLKRRLKEHKAGKVKSTSKRLPVTLVYYEAYRAKEDAISREKYLKSGGKAKNALKLQIRKSLNIRV